ncbi:MAG: aminotransferase class I/II-fold pyridoxal phosphate-dependent enzyme [Chloroflexia bacterium]|nr:aminotransferase class I/II-fold pyridoxal phosphate-dependent enzyme [Chloroflexia bacterium]
MDSRTTRQVQGFGTSIFSEMSRLANQHGAVNLGQGFPDFDGPDFYKEAAKEAIDAGLNQYAISHGAPRLRQAIAATWRHDHGREVDPETEVTVTSGATEALFDAIQAFVGPGDEAIVFEPFYDSYLPSTLLAGGTLRPVTLRPPDWAFDPDELAAAFGPKTRVLLLNTPHNPTGKVFSGDELRLIADLCQRWDVIAITDEVYDRIIFDDAVHLPLAELPGMWERTITINSTGKSFSLTGWKIGYLIAPAAVTAALRIVHQFVTFATSTPMQHASAVALELALANDYYDQLRRDYARRRAVLADVLAASGLPALPIAGGYFLNSDLSGLGFADDVTFCRWLTAEVGVAAVPPSAFYLDPARAPLLARFCFAKRDETLRAAADRLRRVRDLLPGGN